MSRATVALAGILTFLIGLDIGRLLAGTSLTGQFGFWSSETSQPQGSRTSVPPALPPAPAEPKLAPSDQPAPLVVTAPAPPQSALSLPPPIRPVGQPAGLAVLAKGPLSLSAQAQPSLVVIGGAKCGSSDVWHYLTDRFKLVPGMATHPNGEVSPSKEMWCLGKEDHKAVRSCYDKLFAKAPGGALTIDGTPAYIHLYDRHTQPGGNCETSALNFAVGAPDAALLALLRDPMRRSRSEFSWTLHANGGHFSKSVSADLNTHVEVELEYLTLGPQRQSFDLLFQEIDAVDAGKVAHAYRELLDGYHTWLALKPELCQKVSQHPVTTVGSAATPWCKTWPVLIPSFWYPLLLQWRSSAFKPQRAAVVQSEAYYARRDVLDQLMPVAPAGEHKPRGGPNANKQQYSADSAYSKRNVQRLTELFDLPNRRLRELLRRLPSEGVVVVPPVDEPGSWWTA